MKRFFALLLVCILALTCFVGCNAAPDPAKDIDYVKNNGKLVVGITEFKPMDYKDTNGNWIGFDADMAKAFAAYLGVDAEFVVIDWDNKALELKNGSIDVVWNGMTITDEVKGSMGVSEPYCRNAQVVVLNKDIAANYTTKESLKDLTFAVEAGSAGAKALDALKIEYTAVEDQARALMEVQSGKVKACVIDLLMANATIGEGTDYPNLATAGADGTVLALTENEMYGVGFRQESALIAEFNTFWKKAYDDGTVMKTAEKYNIATNIVKK